MRSLFATSFFFLAALSGSVFADPAADMIVVTSPYSRAMPPVVPNSAAFFGLKNFDSKAHSLVSVESMIAKHVEMHTNVIKDGVAGMRRLDHIAIPARGDVKLEPGGHHIMLMGLNRAMSAGTKVLLTLTFEDGSSKTIVAPAQ